MSTLPRDTTVCLWALYVTMLSLLVAPALSFLFHGWEVRKRDILGSLSESAAESYLAAFHPDYLKSPPIHSDGFGKTLKAPIGKTDPQKVEPDKDKSENPRSASTLLDDYYSEQFGRRLFISPLILFLLAAGALLFPCFESAIDWLKSGSLRGGLLPVEVVLAILGGYMWVLNDQVDAVGRDNLSPAQLYWAGFRLVLAVPIAFAFSRFFDFQAFTIPASFFLGTFPTKTIASIARAATTRAMRLGKSGESKTENPLKLLLPIDTIAADQFAAEGITTIFQLADSDPVRLAIRTGMSFTYILDCCGKALLWNYVQDRIKVFERFGMIGVYEVRSLWVKLEGDDENTKKPNAVVLELKEEFKLSEDSLMNMLREIATNPYAKFQMETWMAGSRQKQKSSN